MCEAHRQGRSRTASKGKQGFLRQPADGDFRGGEYENWKSIYGSERRAKTSALRDTSRSS